MITVRELLKESIQTLKRANINRAHLDARLIVAHGIQITLQQVFVRPERQLKKSDLVNVRKLIDRRSKHEPIALIIGEKEFWSLPFKVTAATLIPRPDSETIIEAVLAVHSDKELPTRILDLGTGSGCLLLTLLNEYQYSTGVGIDFSEDALNVARLNAQSLGIVDRVDFVQMNWNDGIPILADFDIIVCNPPYVAENDRNKLSIDILGYEPHSALFAGIDGLREYKTIISVLNETTNFDGSVFFEVGINQAHIVSNMLKNAGLRDISIYPDLAGIGRCVAAKM